MEYLDMLIRLKNVYNGKIVLVSCGAFYIAIGEDAVLLNKKLGLKVTCMKRNVCKVGVPKTSIGKYVEKLNIIGYSYIILDFNKENRELTKKYEKDGKNKDITLVNKNCFNCSRNKSTEYEQILNMYLEKEVGE